MKTLIVLLLFASTVEAQTLADLARQERARKAALKSVHVLTTEDARTTLPTPESPAAPPPADPTLAPAAAATPTPVPTPASIPSPARSEDVAKKYADQPANMRARLIQLQDQEVALQLQINALKNQFQAPVTDATARSEAQTKIDPAQPQLMRAQKEIADMRREIQLLEAQGPPKP